MVGQETISELVAETLTREDGATIAYHRLAAKRTDARSRAWPGIIFLGGFMSDMTGTKATALESFARERGQAFIRFDYLGHGQSSGRFEEGTIGRWVEDAVAVLDHLSEGPQILVGSSMGGWIMLLTALARPARIAGLVGIAAAPDFTEDMLAGLSPEARDSLERDGAYRQPSDYSDEPYLITRELIEDGRRHLLLGGPIAIHCPVRLLQGMADRDVPWPTAIRVAEALESPDVEVTLVKSGDHRLSEPPDLSRLMRTLERLSDAAAHAG